MRNEKVLYMNYPIITSYPNHANILSCISQYEDSMEWFYDYYIQLFAEKNLSQVCFIDFCAPIPWRSCPWIEYQRINRDFIEKKWDCFSDFIIECIDSDYYIFLYLDQFYIDVSWAYQTHHFLHDSFIYGYDKQKKLFNIADFYKNSKYTYTLTGFNQIENAFKNSDLSSINDFLRPIILIKPTPYSNYKFNIDIIKSSLQDYINSSIGTRNYTSGYRIDIGSSQDFWVYGLKVYESLQKHVELFSQNKVPLDTRAFHIVLDHKTLMLKRIDYLINKNIINRESKIYEEYNEITLKALLLRNLTIKSTLIPSEKNSYKIICDISEIIKSEKKAIENILQALENKV